MSETNTPASPEMSQATAGNQIIGSYNELIALPFGSAVLTTDFTDTVVLKGENDRFVNQSGFDIDAQTLWQQGGKPLCVLFSPTSPKPSTSGKPCPFIPKPAF